MMKKTIFVVLFFMFSMNITAQQTKNLSISFSTGMSMTTGDYANFVKPNKTYPNAVGTISTAYGFTQTITKDMQYSIDAAYDFGTFGMGLSFGKFNHKISTIDYNIDFPIILKGGEISGTHYGVGPQYIFSLGKVKFITMLRAGRINYALDNNFEVLYEGENIDNVKIREVSLAKTNLTFASTGIKISYPLGKHFNLFTKVDYFTTFGDGLQFNEAYYYPVDLDEDGVISDADVSRFTAADYLKKEKYTVNPGMINIGAGITYKIPLLGGNSSIKGEPKKKKEKSSEQHRIFESITQSVRVEPTEIVLVSPENNAQFNTEKPLKKFIWEVVGKPFTNPTYIIEVRPFNKEGKAYTAQTTKTSINAKELFKDDKISGQYIWKVVERNTGVVSNLFSVVYTNCYIDMSINNVTSECLGYVGADRKIKICFDVTYESPTGDLTYSNPGSGFFVYDQSYTNLSYTLTGSNTTLQTQIGSSATTVHYCFETIVDSNVTQIGFGLQGDDLDPSDIVCQPGISNGVERLPDCNCDECDEIEINANDLAVSKNPSNPSEFIIDGNVNVNVPIYGIEFQFLSIDYIADPSTCTDGITSIETSGMFLQNGTTIDNSTNILFLNESVSTSGNSNNHASRDIKYLSTNSGSIPTHLIVGLPEPLQGIQAECCKIEYKICMKIIVYYEEDSCKTCQITKCFTFNNQ